jgi:3-oxoacyl-[acyl-carrier-protein] synthase III
VATYVHTEKVHADFQKGLNEERVWVIVKQEEELLEELTNVSMNTDVLRRQKCENMMKMIVTVMNKMEIKKMKIRNYRWRSLSR